MVLDLGNIYIQTKFTEKHRPTKSETSNDRIMYEFS